MFDLILPRGHSPEPFHHHNADNFGSHPSDYQPIRMRVLCIVGCRSHRRHALCLSVSPLPFYRIAHTFFSLVRKSYDVVLVKHYEEVHDDTQNYNERNGHVLRIFNEWSPIQSAPLTFTFLALVHVFLSAYFFLIREMP